METHRAKPHHVPWNKEKLVGQKAPLKLKEIWAIRVRLQMQQRHRELTLFELGIDSKLRACDLVSLRVRDTCHCDRIAARPIVLQQKTRRPVQFEITPSTRDAIDASRQSVFDLSAHKEPASGPAPARARQARKHRALPRY